jgi:hypothetical protein
MPFSWYHPDVPRAYADAGSKADRMYRFELRERAALLMRLGFTKAEAASRLRGNVRWDFALHDQPEHLEVVDEVVEQVFKSRSVGGGGPPTLEG